jgi:D-glycero-D-manno-heptose 1,7-bisphosphate phosphatase
VSVDDVPIPEGVAGALTALRYAGFLIIVVTNQPDVARGKTTKVTVDAINQHLSDRLPIDATYSCLHDGDECACRKPRPKLFLDAIRDRSIDAHRSWMIGDRRVDIAAGRSAGVRTVLLERPYSWSPTSQGSPPSDVHPDAVRTDLGGCATAIVASTRLAG